MITITKTLEIQSHYQFPSNINLEELLFFDIETTGFSADTTSLYLIGCAYYKDDAFRFTQWFADDYQSEKDVLVSFLDFANSYRMLIHYNGQGFDLPYLEKKCKQFELPFHLDQLESADLYKKILPYKSILNLANYKQKTIEDYLDLNRDDKYSGGELIKVYGDYLKAKIMGDERTEQELLSPLLLHNEDDLKSLIEITPILNIRDTFTLPWDVRKREIIGDDLIITARIPRNLHKPLNFGNDLVSIDAYRDTGTITVHIIKDELKFFYDDYKDYYYLPREDMAIHKSVAAYVDKEYRKKAKAANCYIRKEGNFIVQYGERLTPYFKSDYHEKHTYVELTDEFLTDAGKLNIYANHLVKKLSSKYFF